MRNKNTFSSRKIARKLKEKKMYIVVIVKNHVSSAFSGMNTHNAFEVI